MVWKDTHHVRMSHYITSHFSDSLKETEMHLSPLIWVWKVDVMLHRFDTPPATRRVWKGRGWLLLLYAHTLKKKKDQNTVRKYSDPYIYNKHCWENSNLHASSANRVAATCEQTTSELVIHVQWPETTRPLGSMMVHTGWGFSVRPSNWITWQENKRANRL